MGRASLALSGLGGSTTDPAQIFDQKLIKRVGMGAIALQRRIMLSP